MFISEIFHSIQGEGELTGVPSIFVRLSGCNLRCRWCDTPYASWDPQGTTYSVEEVLNIVNVYETRHVVITGGEPMISNDIVPFTRGLREKDHHITIETAGTVPPGEVECDLASISPKLPNSTPSAEDIHEEWVKRHEKYRKNLEALRNWVDGYHYQLKFVISDDEDLYDLQDLIDEIDRDIPPHQILLMPEGVVEEELDDRNEWLVELCRSYGYRYCDRLHIRLFGNTAGT